MNLLIALLIAVSGDLPPEAAKPAPPPASESFAVGQVLTHSLSVCLDEKDAKEIVDAAKVSHEAAGAKWEAKERCQNLPVVGPTVGRVVYSAEIKRDGAKLTLRVVEIVKAGKVIGYFLTTAPVTAKLEVTEPSKIVPNFHKERDI